MLDSETKKRIDDLRDILVGKLPTPQSQVEQITTGLIYKFMSDIDEEAVEMGGVPSFFVGEYKKYSWKNLFDPKLGGVDKVKLYSDAVENMYTNPSAPPLFREIFKNTFLPFRDPSTLNMFLKEINEFHYSDSEKLGDAYEYLISFMGSQGDAGQFRTPRHIIDFIVEIVNPQKNETILDPACGTAGFLISSFKHILNQNTDNVLGDKLNASERKQITENLSGYDISPDMTRFSLVNMYLHQFVSPNIYEYDTLSSEDRWNEYYDVILANPPFFSPKGGIQPHSRFGVVSKRAEVLFVDYIMEHLKPNGRAGIIVPEGIIFDGQNAFKAIRKRLVEECLIGVISLPHGVFEPYSGVKTQILILDKELNQKSDTIFFANVDNDGYTLTKQRSPIKDNDLPEISKRIISQEVDEVVSWKIKKTELLEQHKNSLDIKNYLKNETTHSVFPMLKLGKIAEFQNGFGFKTSQWEDEGKPIIRIQNLTNPAKTFNRTTLDIDSKYHVEKGDLLISWSATIGVFIWEGESALLNQHIFKVKPNEHVLSRYLYFQGLKIKENIEKSVHGQTMTHITKSDFLEIEIPVPSIEVQQEIVDELEDYQKIIDGCRQVVDNYKPTIDIDPSWEMVELGNMATFKRGPFGGSLKKEVFVEEGFLVYEQYHAINDDYTKNRYFITPQKFEEMRAFAVKAGDLIISCSGTIGKISIIPDDHKEGIINQALLRLTANQDVSNIFIKYYLESSNIQSHYFMDQKGSGIENVGSVKSLKTIPFPKISIEQQKKIIKKVLEEKSLVDGNKKLIETYTRKIQNRISKVWGE